MSKKMIGIRQNTMQVWKSGARVAFDPRTTAEVCDTRDDKNYKSAEKFIRAALRLERLREEKEAAE